MPAPELPPLDPSLQAAYTAAAAILGIHLRLDRHTIEVFDDDVRTILFEYFDTVGYVDVAEAFAGLVAVLAGVASAALIRSEGSVEAAIHAQQRLVLSFQNGEHDTLRQQRHRDVDDA